MVRIITCKMIVAAWLISNSAHGQTAPVDTTRRVIVLPDVEVSATKIKRLVVASGKADNSTWHIEAPGGGYAVRFRQPMSGYHALRQVRVHISRLGRISEGQLRVRVASVASPGGPAVDNLLPQAVLLSNELLRKSRRHLTLQWPNAQVMVPDSGFFIVVEGLGRTPDEYVSKLERDPQKPGPPRYVISVRNQPNIPARSTPLDSFPILQGTEASSDAAESWFLDTVTQQWRRSRPGQSVVLLEAVFE